MRECQSCWWLSDAEGIRSKENTFELHLPCSHKAHTQVRGGLLKCSLNLRCASMAPMGRRADGAGVNVRNWSRCLRSAFILSATTVTSPRWCPRVVPFGRNSSLGPSRECGPSVPLGKLECFPESTQSGWGLAVAPLSRGNSLPREVWGKQDQICSNSCCFKDNSSTRVHKDPGLCLLLLTTHQHPDIRQGQTPSLQLPCKCSAPGSLHQGRIQVSLL